MQASTELDINLLFPDIPESIRKSMRERETFKNEVLSWIENEARGPQFNAIRVCKLPKDVNKLYEEAEYCECFALCPFYKHKDAPEGTQCPIERFEVHQWTHELVEDTMIDIDNANSTTDKTLIGEIVIFMLIEQRAVRALAATSVDRVSKTITKQGDVKFEKTKSHYLDVINDAQKHKQALRKALIITREEKAKLLKTKPKNMQQANKAIIEEKIRKAESIKNNSIGMIIDMNDSK